MKTQQYCIICESSNAGIVNIRQIQKRFKSLPYDGRHVCHACRIRLMMRVIRMVMRWPWFRLCTRFFMICEDDLRE